MLTGTEAWAKAVASIVGDMAGELPGSFPFELADLPAAARRGAERAASSTDSRYPSVERALHDVIISEMIADRLSRRSEVPVDLDALVETIGSTLEYFAELSVTRIEGEPVTHGVVVTGHRRVGGPVVAQMRYPGRLPTRKRTPLLFDGTQSLLVVGLDGCVERAIDRSSLSHAGVPVVELDGYDEFPGLDGALTAAASAVFGGIGFYLGANHTTWVFDRGALLFVRRGTRWRSIAFETFTRSLADLGQTDVEVGRRIARAALRVSMQGYGALLAIAHDPAALPTVIEFRDRAVDASSTAEPTVDDDLRDLLRLHRVDSPGGLARLARLDGATIVDTAGQVLAYGAVVRSTDSRGEGARSAAARALSRVTGVSVCVSQDGPITVFHDGEPKLDLL